MATMRWGFPPAGGGDDIDVWLEGSAQDAPALVKPFASERMQNLLTGPRKDMGQTP
jgi:hypothetical protein